MRTKGYGICMTFGKLGCIIVPIYVSYLQIFSQNPLVYIGFFCLFAIALSFRLPETYDQQMKDRLDEADGRKEFEMVDKTKEKGEILESEDDIFTN